VIVDKDEENKEVKSLFKLNNFKLNWKKYYNDKPEPDHQDFLKLYSQILWMNTEDGFKKV
jgi:hypothetical protein